MNSFILIAELANDPQRRETQDQRVLAQFDARFPGTRPDETPGRVRVVGWGELAEEIIRTFHKGDRVAIEGRLHVNLVEREGYKEKVAEVVAQRITPLEFTLAPTNDDREQPLASSSFPSSAAPLGAESSEAGTNFDDIPF